MSIVAAISTDKFAVVVSDGRAGVIGEDGRYKATGQRQPKVHKINDVIIAGTGSEASMHFLRSNLLAYLWLAGQADKNANAQRIDLFVQANCRASVPIVPENGTPNVLLYQRHAGSIHCVALDVSDNFQLHPCAGPLVIGDPSALKVAYQFMLRHFRMDMSPGQAEGVLRASIREAAKSCPTINSFCYVSTITADSTGTKQGFMSRTRLTFGLLPRPWRSA